LHLPNFFAIDEEMTERGYLGDVSAGSVYAALERLEAKGLVTSSLGETTPERGGRAKRYFRVTEDGLRTAHETRRVLNQLWKKLPSVGGDPA
jgi:DNA-binding PadR family transcriptional regulator